MAIPHPVRLRRHHPYAAKLDIIAREIQAGAQYADGAISRRVIDLVTDHILEHARAQNPVIEQSEAMALAGQVQVMALQLAGHAREYVNLSVAGSQIFRFGPRLIEMLTHTEVGEIPSEELPLPYDCFYIALESPIDTPRPVDRYPDRTFPVDGAYIRRVGDGFTILPTTAAMGDSAAWPDDFLHALSGRIHVPLLPGQSLETCLREGAARYVTSLKTATELETFKRDQILGPDDALGLRNVAFKSLTRDLSDLADDAEQSGRLIAVVRSIIRVVANALCYISEYRADARIEWSQGTPQANLAALGRAQSPKKIQQLERQLLWDGYRRTLLFPEPEGAGEGRGGGSSIGTHWRRGHWRMTPFGPGRAQRRKRWIRPVRVNADRGAIEAPGRVYELDAPPEAGSVDA